MNITILKNQDPADIINNLSDNSVITFEAGTYYPSKQINIKPGQTLVFNNTVLDFTKNTTNFIWWQGLVNCIARPGSDKGLEFKGKLTLIGDPNKNFIGLNIVNVDNVNIDYLGGTGFYHAHSVFTSDYGRVSKNVTISEIDIKDSSNEGAGGCMGQITFEGSWENIDIPKIKTLTTKNTKVSQGTTGGYGIKFRPNYYVKGGNWVEATWENTVKNVRLGGVDIQGIGNSVFPTSPNIGIEVYHVIADDFKIENGYTNLQLSTGRTGVKGYTVSNMTFEVTLGQFIELAGSNNVYENCVFDFRKNVNAWNFAGEYTMSPELYSPAFDINNQLFKNCRFEFGDKQPILLVYKTKAKGIVFDNCIFNGTKEITLVEGRQPTSEIEVTFKSNCKWNVPYKLKQVSEGADINKIKVTVDSVPVSPPVPVIESLTIEKDGVYTVNKPTIITVKGIEKTIEIIKEVIKEVPVEVIKEVIIEPEYKVVWQEDLQYPGYGREIILRKKKISN